MTIDWKVRLTNKTFWLTLIPALLMLATEVAKICGLNIDLTGLQTQILDIIGLVFVILALLGIVANPTTKGLSDPKEEKKPIE